MNNTANNRIIMTQMLAIERNHPLSYVPAAVDRRHVSHVGGRAVGTEYGTEVVWASW